MVLVSSPFSATPCERQRIPWLSHYDTGTQRALRAPVCCGTSPPVPTGCGHVMNRRRDCAKWSGRNLQLFAYRYLPLTSRKVQRA
ncbi:hypothetical protein MRX96_032061 [Rhipicephalus microplus]